MKRELRNRKQEERQRERKQRQIKITIGVAVAVVALAVGFVTTSPARSSSPETAAPATEAFRRITIDELKPLFDRGAVTIIDVRDAGAFEQAHIPGALQIPLARVDGEVEYLPKDRMIVTYCTCPAEESSGQAVQILAHRGVANAAALQGGLAAWQNRGYPLDAGLPRQ